MENSKMDEKSRSSSEEVTSGLLDEVVRPRKAAEEYRDNDDDNDDGLLSLLMYLVRILTCFVVILVTTLFWTFIMLLLLPWPYERARQGNYFGHFTGRLVVWILGNTVKIEGKEYAEKRAIYISNHASIIDMFLTMWLTPTGTVSIAKKEIVWYPLIGQLYFLANHPRIDRSNPQAAIKSMKEVSRAVHKNNLSLIIFPEGTRSKNGRLLPFKKGFVHLALQTRLPLVPIVLIGTHKAWRKGGLRVRPVHITVRYLPPINTEDWTEDKINEYVNMVHDIFVNNLPDSQKPVSS
ncbi:1-acyl-sn-glycerol-3-phosphate acyltransferase-like [Silene latifolia]|uniref:1-acyl-sn-glycerol-3-phosphate acyltransferase-like n=1 Tax=Silene latifolia TaxID=37657 RepID=UPI003D78820C